MKQYLDLLQHIIDNGVDKDDRTGTGTRSVFGYQMRFDLSKGFPLLTTKKVHLKSIIYELLFFISGNTNQRYLTNRGVNIWKEWGDENLNLGPVYSHQWRNFGGKHLNRMQPPSPGKTDSAGYVKGENEIADKLYTTWRGIHARCYNPGKSTYYCYGGKGVSVCDRWFTFSLFAEDVKYIDGWENKEQHWDDYQLDKDLFGDGFTYSPADCVWVSRESNMRGKYTVKYKVGHDDGRVAEFCNPIDFYTEHGISQGNFCQMLKGQRLRADGWFLISKEDQTAGVDQLAELIDSIKTNPDSRRHLVSAWNPTDLQFMALPPCHCLFQCYVANGKLSLQLYQRSADVFLGVPFNIASYALLTMMLASVCGLQPGEFIWTGGDTHLYSNHFEQAKLQLSRKPFDLPRMAIRPGVTSLFDFKYDDFTLIDYTSHPGIAAPIAV